MLKSLKLKGIMMKYNLTQPFEPITARLSLLVLIIEYKSEPKIPSLTLLGAGGGCLRPDVFVWLTMKKIALTTCYVFRLLFLF